MTGVCVLCTTMMLPELRFGTLTRQPFKTLIKNGNPSMIMQWREISHNFFIDNYSPQEDVDNDDGSCYYLTHNNFLVYGGRGMKNDFGGHDNRHYNNVYGYVGQAVALTGVIDGHEDHVFNNYVVMTGTDVGGLTCSGTGKTFIRNNSYFTSTGDVTECKSSLHEWQKHGNDPESSVGELPDSKTIIARGLVRALCSSPVLLNSSIASIANRTLSL
eukprot:INCI7199.3.p1 GENE.INCI7199.3~~INCI7199.3.p1  ORF type:complete len:216 (-),score=34.29 INCI7199.3:74-721(-)